MVDLERLKKFNENRVIKIYDRVKDEIITYTFKEYCEMFPDQEDEDE